MPDFNELLHFTIDWLPPQMTFTINWVGIALLLIGALITINLIRWLMKRNHFRLNQVQLSLPMGVNVGIQRNEATLYIANRIHVELVTRKAALVFDPEHDNILEVYNSLYVLFKNIREELKNIPGGYLKDYPSSQELLDLGITILNNGLRPHLTQHQARYRAWYNRQHQLNPDLSPQQLQVKYPDYQLLIEDLQAVNRQVITWATQLKKLLKNN